jgi:acetoin utilization protein AcuB
MFASLLLDTSIPTLSMDDTVSRALSLMHTNSLHRIPIVDVENKYLGNVHEEDLLDVEEMNQAITSFIQEKLPINTNEHFLNILRNEDFVKNGSIIVVDNEWQFIGVVTSRSLLEYMGRERSVEMQGGILVLEIKSIHYSLSEISRLVESNNANVIHSCISNSTNIENMLITIKIDKLDLKEIISTFERYHYQVIAEFDTSSSEDDILERYDSLMMYLNV